MSKIAVSGNASGTGTFTIQSPATNTDRVLTLPDEAGTVLTNSGYITADGTNLILKADGTNEDARLDSSGNLLVGRTSVGATGNGHSIRGGDSAIFSRDASGETMQIGRNASNGQIVRFNSNGSEVGSIGTVGGYLALTNSLVGIALNGNTSSIVPATSSGEADNSLDIGRAGARWDDIYATNGTIQTSDRNEKQNIEELSEAERNVAIAAKALLRKFRWKDAVEEKGDDARIHFGIIAQDLQAAFEAEGLDAGRYAMFISSTWWEAEETYTDDDGVEQTRTNTYDTAEEAPEGATERTRLGVRYPELLAFIIGAL